MVNRDAPYSGLANLMAMNGRFGDTELVHMSKPEIRGLASLGELTINPDTGLPEAFSLGNILPLAINIGLGAATGGMSTFAQAAIMGGVNLAMGLAQDKSFGDALFGAALGAAGPALMRGITGAAGAGAGAVSGSAPTGVEGSLASSASPTFTEGALALPTDAQIMAGITPPGFGGVSTDAFFTDAISTHGGELGGVGQGMGSVSPPTPSFGSKIANWIGDNPLEATGVGGLGLAGLAALSGGEEEVDVIEEEIQPLPRSEFTGHKTRGPFTEQQLLDLALRGGAALDDDDIDEDGQLAYDFFTPGSYTRKNDGGLVGIPQTKQRSNVTNFMLAEDKGMPSSLSVFELGKSLGNMGKEQPNSGIMQLAVGGQPKSNIAQMLNPTLERQAPTPSLNYDELRRRAYLQGEDSPLNIYQTQHEDILRDTLGKIVEDSREEVIETPEEPVAPVAPIPKPVNVFSDDGNPDAADEEDAEAAAAADEEEAAVSEDAAEIAEGGIVGLAHGGKLKHYDEAFDSLYKLGVEFPQLERMLAGETEASLPLEKRLRRVNPKSKATGLFQFIPKVAKELGTTTSKIKEMSAKEQGDLYAQYLKKHKWQPGIPLGMMQAAPSMANKPDDHIVYKKGSKAYKQNPNWIGPEGEITVESIKKYYDPNYNMEPQEESDGGLDIIKMLKGILPLSEGGTINQYFEGQVVGKGDGMSDQIMFEVQGKKPDKALLSKDEYVLPGDMVSILGNGSSNAGAEVLDQFVKDTRQKGFGTQRQQRQINPQKGLSALV